MIIGPYSCQIKHGKVCLEAVLIIMTTNQMPHEWWENIKRDDYDKFHRRISAIFTFYPLIEVGSNTRKFRWSQMPQCTYLRDDIPPPGYYIIYI